MRRLICCTAATAAAFVILSCSAPKAELILRNGEIYTMEADQPWASALAVSGNRIIAVLDRNEDADRYAGPNTRIIDLKGRFVVPGFIDGHTHFSGAGAMIQGVNLLTVADDEGLRKEMQRVVAIVGEGEWVTGGLWGAYESWALGAAAAGVAKKTRWEPDRRSIDDLTPNHPCFLNSFDSELFLANTAALKAAGLENARLEGMKRDPKGVLTGLIYAGSAALAKLRAVVKPKSNERLLNESRAGLRKLAESGIVEIHDITGPDQTERFVKLQQSGELTCRIWMRPDLSRGVEFQKQGLKMGMHPDNYGHYRTHTSDDPKLLTPNMKKIEDLIRTGVEAGFVTNVHAIGDKGVALMLDTYEKLMRERGKTLEGFRVIHAQVIRPEDFPRFKALHVIAEINPYHISDDMRWMEERIGRERCKGAYAFRSLLDNGALLSFGSDWPGTSAAEYLVHPRYLIHAAVNRTTLKGEPEGGWFPEQKITVAEALKAYTINNAVAAFEADVRGTLKVGKLADIAVLDRNLLKIKPSEILKLNVDMTIVDGKVVFER
jgi:predicted amidohydrolase YtcJ